MRKHILKNCLLAGIIFILFCSSFVSNISGYSKFSIQENVNIENSYESQEKVVVSCQTFGIPGKSLRQTEMSKREAENLLAKINDIAEIIANDSLSDLTVKMQEEIISLTKEYELLPMDISFADFQPRCFSTLKRRQPKKALNPVNGNRGTASFCNFATAGEGAQFPIIILPRMIPILLTPIPRVFLHWSSNIGYTTCGSYLTRTGFMAGGMQRGTALGFWGIGFSVFLPPVMVYGFVGYALFVTCSAEIMEPWPPNYAPEVSAVSPVDGAENVDVTTSELSFQIGDRNRDKMNYTVTTDPDIGSGSGSNVEGGIYSILISGLEGTEEYSWHVSVDDGDKTVEEAFTFTTESVAPIISNPKPEDGKQFVPIDITELSFYISDPQGDLIDFTVETQPNIGSGNNSGVPAGTYSISIYGLENMTDYTWFVNATDGTYTKHNIFTFQTEPLMIFDPFDEGWQYRKKITIDYNQVEGDLTNFPVVIDSVDLDITKAQDDGDDILFMDDSGVATRLFHEIEYYDDSNGLLTVWVNVTNIDSDQNTTLYIYYGNPSCISQQFPIKVWDSNYKAVYHLKENTPAGTRYDSTENNCHGTPYQYEGDEATPNGRIDGADDFDGNNDHIRTSSTFDYDYRTVSFWFNADNYAISDDLEIILTQQSYQLIYGAFHASIDTEGGLKLSAAQDFTFPKIQILTNNWYLCHMIRNGSKCEYYISGDFYYTSPSNSGGPTSNPNKYLSIATDRTMTRRFFDGTIDEIHILNEALSSDWILTEYNNQNNPSSFLSLGNEEKGS